MENTKNKYIVCLLSLLFPGLGHLYLRDYSDGIVFILGAGFLWFALFAENSQAMNFESIRSSIFWIGFAIVYVFALVHALVKANKISLGK
ncbi:hypothetical protein HZA85_00585 [Candidatus Uhrbacteria bacterium]|nr:hypothetical protein [Candidatus Uhrbacteria bacterium]